MLELVVLLIKIKEALTVLVQYSQLSHQQEVVLAEVVMMHLLYLIVVHNQDQTDEKEFQEVQQVVQDQDQHQVIQVPLIQLVV